MSARITSRRLIALAGALLLCGAGIGVPTKPALAAECLGAPTSAPPEGNHWYYRTDRAKGRKCWFLRSLNPPVQDTAAQEDAQASAPAADADAVKESATASADAHFEASTAISSPPLPVPKPQSAPTANATTPEPVRQPIEEKSAAAPIPEPPASQPSEPVQTNAQQPATPPAAPMVWPDPPTVATVKVQKPDQVSDNAPPHAAQPPAVVRPAHDLEGVAQMGKRTSEAATTTTASAGTLAGLLFVVVLGLIAAGLLYRLVAKIAAMRDRRIIMDHSGLDWVHDDRQELQFGVGRRQRGFVDEREKFVDDRRLSLVPTADDYGARRPRQAPPLSNAFREVRAAPIADESRMRDNRWAQLLRDLDQIMQSRKEA